MHGRSATTTSPKDAVLRTYRAIKEYDDPALFISLKSEDEAIAEAEQIERRSERGALFGRVFAAKDNIDVRGLPTTAACPAFAYTPEESAFVVQLLEAAGAIAIGKTNLDQFATGLVGVRSPYGTPRNALREDLIPGGSSSGSAVAVAAGVVDFALGTDTAGSGRIPAGMNGIVGLKPSLGMLSATGMVPACRTLDTVSVFAPNVASACEVAAIAAAYDARDAYSKPFPRMIAGAPPGHFRVGVPRADQRMFFGDSASEKAFASDIGRLEQIGAEVIEVDFEPLHAVARLLYEGPWVAERYAATKALVEGSPDVFHPITFKIISGARGLTAVSAFEATYRLADFRRTASRILDRVDMLLVPTVPRFYTTKEVEAEPIQLNSNLGSYTNFVNLLDLCAISVPVGERDDGLPSSITLIGKAGTDAYLASVAAAAEGRPMGGPTPSVADRINIAVVGAHLSGLPLNGQLVDAGGVFVSEARTSADYALFALEGTKPAKPGLLRVATGAGSSIALEIWSLPTQGFGRFVADIPSPLGIGSVQLSSGVTVKGFLVEAEAVKRARDISQFGGWRAFLDSPRD